MGFLTEFNAVSDNNPQAQVGTVVKWLRGNWREMFGELRESCPILPTPAFTLVTRATDVLDILAQPSLYSVKANRLTMDPSVGPFMLARDETAVNWHEKSLMRAVLRWDDLPDVRALARKISADSVANAAGNMLDIIPSVGRLVPLRIVQHIFGFGGSDADMLRWSFATQHAMFRNLPFNPDVVAKCVTAGQEMQAWLWPFLAAKWAAAPVSGNDAVSRLVNLSRLSAAGLAADRVVSNVCGLLVGSIETMNQAIAQTVDQFLAHPKWLKAALTADASGDIARFDGYVFEALRFNPITTVQFRLAEADRVIGAGTAYATPVKAGTVVAVCTGSAMFDADLMPYPETFNPARPANSYLHFGIGHHDCLGRHVGQVAIPEAVRQIIRLPNIRRAAGAAGKIDFSQGPFPEHFTVAWNATPKPK
jgi:cytochrome P450